MIVGESRTKHSLWVLFFLLPASAGLILFTVLPIVSSFILSLFSWDLLGIPEFVLLENFKRLSGDQKFWKSLVHTLSFVGGYIPAVLVTGLLTALLMNSKIKGRGAFRTAFFIPVVTSWIAVALLWTWLFNPKFGLINYILALVGINGPAWLYDPKWAMTAVIITSVWKDTGYVMMLFLAGLQDIPASLLEAASIDGASGIKRFTAVTLPLLSPTTFFILVISLINSFQVFDQVWVMTGGGPSGATSVLVEQIYKNAFRYNNMGYASAISLILFLIILIITVLQSRVQKLWVHYV
ncbi:MAG: sugar ABC transporter permease [Spirochaetales bacterium]|nr:sugar ABC transporter permease [Spirochaetales bacterium]